MNSVSTENKTLKIRKLKGFNSFHNVQHEDKRIRMWKAFSVGSGRFIPYSEIFLQHQGPTNLKVEEDMHFFSEVGGRSFKTKQDKTSDLRSETDREIRIYECSEPGCAQEFDSMVELDVHVELEVHELVHPNESIYD